MKKRMYLKIKTHINICNIYIYIHVYICVLFMVPGPFEEGVVIWSAGAASQTSWSVVGFTGPCFVCSCQAFRKMFLNRGKPLFILLFGMRKLRVGCEDPTISYTLRA